jgi:myosin heavy subunit
MPVTRRSLYPERVELVGYSSHSYRSQYTNSDHAILCSGKTESAKMVISYVVGRASSDAGSPAGNIEERLLQSSPILEAFGNAKSKS